MAGKSGRTISTESRDSGIKRFLKWETALILVFVAVNVLGAALSPYYKLSNILRQMPQYLAEIFIMFPMGYILIIADIDISVGSIVCLSATMACIAANAGAPIAVTFIISLLVGLACGMFNGLILTKFTELPAMIVTLATQIIFRGIAEIVLGSGGSISYSDTAGIKLLATKIGSFPIIFFVLIAVGIVYIIVLAKTTFGRRLYAIGSNKTAAYYAGIGVQKIRFICFSLAGLMSGLCAIFITAYMYAANTTTGDGYEMDVIAMAVFGGIASTGGKGNLIGATIAAFTIVCLRIGLGLINMNSQLILVIIGALLVISVMIPGISQSFKERVKKTN